MILKKSQTVSSSVILYIMKENFSNDYFSKDLNLDVQMWKKICLRVDEIQLTE